MKLNKFQNIAGILLTIFALYLIFQIIRNILGGSWGTEDILLGLLIFNLGSIFTIVIMFAQLKSDHRYLKMQFRSLATDFKLHIKKK